LHTVGTKLPHTVSTKVSIHLAIEISSTASTKENKATLSKLDVRALPVSYAVKIVTAGLVTG